MGLEGKLDFEVEIQSSADEFYHIWRNQIYHLPNVSSDAIQSVQLHEGEWHSEDAVKLWNYTLEGKALTAKERVEVGDANKVLTFNIIRGDLLEEFKTFKAIVKTIAKSDGRGSLVKWTLEYEKLHEGVANPNAYIDLEVKLTKDADAHLINNARGDGLGGKLEFEVEIQSSADEFYNIWRNHMYHLPNASSDAVQSVQLHEGEWHSEDAVKLWTYTVEGKTLTVKERIEVDDANKVLIFNIIGGDLLEEFKTFKAIVKLTAKSDGRGSLAKWTLEYEKLHEGVADPTACMDLEIKLTKDTDAHIINNA